MLDFTEASYVLGIWFVSHDPRQPVHERSDVLLAAWRDHPEDDWILRYRIRHHRSTDVWESQDEKRWYDARVAASTPEEELLALIEDMMSQFSGLVEQPVASVIVQGTGRQAITLMAQQPWCHMRPANSLD